MTNFVTIHAAAPKQFTQTVIREEHFREAVKEVCLFYEKRFVCQ
jgi:hypothetical protein